MISQYDFYYELKVQIVFTCLYALLFIISIFLNFQSHSTIINYKEQHKAENEKTQILSNTSLSS
jgi:O-antigen/teichoic acid export membrane protein